MNKQVHEMNHPLIMHKISILRNEATPVKEFRELVNEIALLMGYEATRDLDMVERPVKTRFVKQTESLFQNRWLFVPVLRAGLGMVDALMSLIPAAKVGHIGLYRDPETHVPVEYYCKLPNDISGVRLSFSTRCLQRAAARRRQSTSSKNTAQRE